MFAWDKTIGKIIIKIGELRELVLTFPTVDFTTVILR